MADFRFSKHARLRMIERGISEKEVKKAIQEGSKTRQDGKIVSSYSYFQVVYKKKKDIYYIITVMIRW